MLDLGDLAINAFPLPSDPEPERAPLELTVCEACGCCQLRHTVNPDRLYRQFWYRSSVTDTMKKALNDIVRHCRHNASVLPGDTVVDIGSNDSTLLRMWPSNVNRVGFEPAENLMAEAREGGIQVVNEYFSAAAYWRVVGKPAEVITAAAMFYDLEDPIAFLQDVAECLTDRGVFICQVSYLDDMLSTNDFACVCHEHLCYYSLSCLVKMFMRVGLHVFDVAFNKVNGGSVRISASKAHRYTASDVDIPLIINHEECNKPNAFEDFAKRVRAARERIIEVVGQFDAPYVYGASTKGNTMLQYWGLGYPAIHGAAERDERKYGRRTVTGIPIVSEEEARAKADLFLVLPWYFRNEIVTREKQWLNRGGVMLFPMPVDQILGGKQ